MNGQKRGGILYTHTHTLTLEYYSGKKNEILPVVKTQSHLEGVTLIEISQMEKNKYHIISLASHYLNHKN